MEEQDRQFIEALFARQGEQFQQALTASSEQLRQELRQGLQANSEQLRQELRQGLQANSEQFQQELRATKEDFKQHASSVVEIVDHQISIIAEGHHAVLDKLEVLEARFDRLEARVDTIGTELAANRADTEAHHGVYRVKES